MTINTKFMFQIDANGKVISGTKLEWSGDPTAIPSYPSNYTTEGTQQVWDNQDLSTYANGAWTIATPNIAKQLATAQSAKITELQTARDNILNGGFTSSALSTVHTYDSYLIEKTRFSAELSALNDATIGPTITNVPWNTRENGFVVHTIAQFKQVYSDGRNWEQNNMVKCDTKVKQTNACTTTAQVATITFNNTTPPTIPTGLTGTAGATGSGQATLNWTANTDVTMLYGGGYNVYKAGVKVNTSLITTNNYTATGLATGTYSFTITAVDTDGNESAKSTAVSVTVS